MMKSLNTELVQDRGAEVPLDPADAPWTTEGIRCFVDPDIPTNTYIVGFSKRAQLGSSSESIAVVVKRAIPAEEAASESAAALLAWERLEAEGALAMMREILVAPTADRSFLIG